MNADCKPDLVAAGCCGNTSMFYQLGNGDGTFQPAVLFNGGPSPHSIAVADYNRDGKPDLAMANQAGNGYVTVLLNTTPLSFVTTSATAGQIEPFAPDTIVSAYGANLAISTDPATVLPLPTSIDGTTVTITDSAGVSRLAPLFYVSPTQINYEIPAGTAPGTATVTITNKNGSSQTATIEVGSVSPGLFALNSSQLVAAWVLPVINGIQQKPPARLQVKFIGRCGGPAD